MARMTRNKLAGAVLLTLMISVGGAAQAGEESDRSSTWALGNILHGLATAMSGEDATRPLQVNRVTGEAEAAPTLQAQVPSETSVQVSAAD